jgi:HrpA-like RNA helicase
LSATPSTPTGRQAASRLTFCTTGILIQRLMVDPQLASVTHVIIDEVHERGLEVSWGFEVQKPEF